MIEKKITLIVCDAFNLSVMRNFSDKLILLLKCGLSSLLIAQSNASEFEELRQELKDLQEQESAIVNRRAQIKERMNALGSQKSGESEQRDSVSSSNLTSKKMDADKSKKTSASMSYYWDDRDFTTLNLLTSTTGLPYDFSIWGFIDLHGAHESSSTDLSRYFIEYRLNRKIDAEWIGGMDGLGFQAEFNDATGPENNLFRFGLTYRHSLPEILGRKGWLQWRGFPYETDGSGQQASLIYFLPLHERAWISGFADINFRQSQKDAWVIEPQLTYKLDDRFSLLLEYRYNEIEKGLNLDGEGVAFGLEVSF